MSLNFQRTSAPRAPIEAFFLSTRQAVPKHPASKNLCDSPLWHPFFSCARCSFSRHCSKPQPRSSSSHSVPSMQFQVLLTCLSAFFSTFLRSTSSLSVFMSYLDLGEIYLLLYAEITINVTLKAVEIRESRRLTREYHPLCCSFPTDFQSAPAPPSHCLKRSIGHTVVVP